MFAPDHQQAASELQTGVPAGRPDRPRQLDAAGLPRTAVEGRRRLRAADAGRPVAAAVGHRRAHPKRSSPASRRSNTRRGTLHSAIDSPEHWVDVFRTYYGPVHKAFAALDAERQAALESDLLALLRRADRGGSAGLVVPAEYLETVITR